jgi:CRISPR-associated protein Csm3
LAGLKLLELDGIGGSGSRGYGKVRFVNLKQNKLDIQAQFDSTEAFA